MVSAGQSHQAIRPFERAVLTGDVAFQREVRRVDPEQKAVPHDRLVFDLQRLAECREIGIFGVISGVAHGRGHDARRRRCHERLGDSRGGVCGLQKEVRAFRDDGRRDLENGCAQLAYQASP